MCLLVKQPSTTAFTNDFLEDVYNKNSDGFGVMYAEGGKVHVYKCLPRSAQEMVDFYAKHAEGRDCIWHARMQTHGDIDIDNCHPYMVTDDIYLAHNGVLSCGNNADRSKSDTWHFIRNIMRPALTAEPDLMLDPTWISFIGAMIGSSNKFGLVRADGHMVVINESSGVEFVGAWLSNTYAWTPSKFGFRSSYQSQGGYTDMYSGTGRHNRSHSYSHLWDEDEGYGVYNMESNYHRKGYGIVGNSYPVATTEKVTEAKGSYIKPESKAAVLTQREIAPMVRAAYNQWTRKGIVGIEQWVKDAPHKAAAILGFWYNDEDFENFAVDDPAEAAFWIEDLFSSESITPSMLS